MYQATSISARACERLFVNFGHGPEFSRKALRHRRVEQAFQACGKTARVARFLAPAARAQRSGAR